MLRSKDAWKGFKNITGYVTKDSKLPPDDKDKLHG